MGIRTACLACLLLPGPLSAGILSGRLLRADIGLPLSNLTVRVDTLTENPGADADHPIGIVAHPGSDGRFAVALPSQDLDYQAVVTGTDGHVYVGVAHVPAHDDFDAGDLVCRRGFRLQGTLAPASGPLPSNVAVVARIRLQSQSCHHYVEAARTASDVQGHFVFPDLSPGEYDVAVQSDRFWALLSGASVTGASRDVEVQLRDAAILSGRVITGDGQPLAGARLATDQGRSTPTDSNGMYRLAGLPGGELLLSFSHPQFALPCNEQIAVSLVDGQVLTQDLLAVPVGFLSVALTATHGPMPLPAVLRLSLVPLEDLGGPAGYEVMTLTANRFPVQSPGLAPGSYALTVRVPGLRPFSCEVTILSGQNTDIRVPFEQTWSVAGTAQDIEGNPLQAVDVCAWLVSPTNDPDGSGTEPAAYARSRRDGGFVFTDLLPGSYRYEARHVAYLPDAGTFIVRSGSNSPLVCILDPGLSIRGRVERTADLRDLPIEISAIRTDEETVGTHRTTVQPDGTFEIGGLEAGFYSVSAHAAEGDIPTLLTRMRDVTAGGEDLVLTPGATRRITVTARSPSGTALPGVSFTVAAVEPEMEEDGEPADAFEKSLPVQYRTDATGAFHVSLRSGLVYRLGAWQPPYLPASTNLDYTLRDSTARTNLVFTLIPGVTVSGLVSFAGQGAVPFTNIAVTAWNDTFQSFSPDYAEPPPPEENPLITRPDSTGRFTFAGIPQGVLVLEAWYFGSESPCRLAKRRIRVDGPVVPSVQLETTPVTRLAGSVLEASGNPVAGAMVFAINTLDPAVAFQAVTDGRGQFEIRDVPLGYYILTPAHSTDNGLLPGLPLPLDLQRPPAAPATLRFDRVLWPLQGQLIRAGDPCGSVTLGFMPVPLEPVTDAAWTFYGGEIQVGTDPDGRFTLGGMSPGPCVYYVYPTRRPGQDPDQEPSVSYSGLLTLAPGQTGLVINLQGTTVSGHVTRRNGEVAAESMVTLVPAGLSPLMREARTLWRRVDNRGDFRFDCVEPGRYEIQAHHDAGTSPRRDVTVQDTPVTQALALAAAYLVEGTVRDSAAASPRGAAVLALADPDDEPAGFGTVDDRGRCSIMPELPAGTYRLLVLKEGSAVESVRLTVPDTTSFRAVLVPGGDLRVRAVARNGQAVGGRAIRVETDDGQDVFRLDRHQVPGGVWAMTLAPRTDPHGFTRIQGLHPGLYRVRTEGVATGTVVRVTALEETRVNVEP